MTAAILTKDARVMRTGLLRERACTIPAGEVVQVVADLGGVVPLASILIDGFDLPFPMPWQYLVLEDAGDWPYDQEVQP